VALGVEREAIVGISSHHLARLVARLVESPQVDQRLHDDERALRRVGAAREAPLPFARSSIDRSGAVPPISRNVAMSAGSLGAAEASRPGAAAIGAGAATGRGAGASATAGAGGASRSGPPDPPPAPVAAGEGLAPDSHSATAPAAINPKAAAAAATLI
jgi:hypothetical protein